MTVAEKRFRRFTRYRSLKFTLKKSNKKIVIRLTMTNRRELPLTIMESQWWISAVNSDFSPFEPLKNEYTLYSVMVTL